MNLAWRRLLALVAKDALDALRNQTALIVLLSPLLLAFLLRSLGSNQDVKPVLVGLVAGPDSGFQRVLAQHPGLRLVPCAQLEQARQRLERREFQLLVAVAPDFDSQLLAGERPALKLWADPASPTQVALGREYLRACLRQQAGQTQPARIELQNPGATPTRSFWLGSAALLACMSAMVIAAANLVEEKEAGTLQQMLLSPATPTELWIGKLAVSAALGSLSAMMVIALHGLRWVDVGSTLGLTILASFVFAAVGGIIGLLANGPAAASSWTGLCFIALFAPASLSETSQALSRWAQVSPAYYLYDGVQRTVLAQESAASQAVNFGVLLSLGVVLTWIGARLLRTHR